MLEGKNVNLRVMEKEDLPLVTKWANDPEFAGEFEPLEQVTREEVEKWHSNLDSEEKWFMIEKKDGKKIGHIFHSPKGPHYLIGYRLLPSERSKGYCTEAVKILVDYLFRVKRIVRIQAETNPRNIASQRVLEKAGFKKEGVIRKSIFIRGKWEDGVLYSILREEWDATKVKRPASVKV
ncbi:MAG: GNAT family N-acetyltransferase [Candidatus Bathyarchaeota archaeon]|nr:MAG: GNAT family N-acetyltransferase [Candidatus Bathyarchaeota archaeon]